MTGSSDDIKDYLNIIQGNFPIMEEKQSPSISFGISTADADIGQLYLFENGLRWAKIINEVDNHWIIEHGFLEYEADSTEYISKMEMTSMIRLNEMVKTIEEERVDILEETLNMHDTDYDDYMNKIERYLLINENRETFEFDYDWKNAWSTGKDPIETVEDAILMEG